MTRGQAPGGPTPDGNHGKDDQDGNEGATPALLARCTAKKGHRGLDRNRLLDQSHSFEPIAPTVATSNGLPDSTQILAVESPWTRTDVLSTVALAYPLPGGARRDQA